jgi:DNA repair and recombination RAD54-like protein
MCAANKWGTLRLDGSCSVKQRQGLVDRFNDSTDKSYCFLVGRSLGPSGGG